MRKMLSAVNRKLAPMKGHYFLYNAGTAPVVPYLSTYARQLGLSSAVVGVIYLFLPISGMIAKPVVGAIADRFRCHKALFLISMLITGGAFLSILYAPNIPLENNRIHFQCDEISTRFDTSIWSTSVDNCSVQTVADMQGTTNCNLDCTMETDYWSVISSWGVPLPSPLPETFEFEAIIDSSKTTTRNDAKNQSNAYFTVDQVVVNGLNYTPKCLKGRTNDISTSCAIKCDNFDLNSIFEAKLLDKKVYGMYQFWIFLSLMVLGWVGQAIVVSIGDAICFGLLGDQPTKFGYQRMFGALGWGIFAIISGFMIDAMSHGSSKKNFEMAFYIACLMLLLDCVCSYQLKHEQTKMSANIFKDVGKLLMNIRIIVFLLWCISIGMCTALMWQFFFYLIEDLAYGTGCGGAAWIKTLEGLLMAVQTLAGEMPFFFWSRKILKRIGHTNAMSLVLVVFGIRYILYSIITNPWWFLPVEVLNGLTFGLFYACMTSYASIVAPPGTEATMQGLVGAIFEGVGVSLGSFVGGMLYDIYHGPKTFRMFGIGALICSVLHFGVQYLLNRQGKKEIEAQYTSPLEEKVIYCEDEQELKLMT